MAQQLKMLRTTYVDVLSIHTPHVLKEQGDFLRAWRQMEPMADKGYARHLGLSNFDPHHLEEFIGILDLPGGTDAFIREVRGPGPNDVDA